MNSKQLLILLLIGLALGGAGIYLSQKKAASFERAEKTPEGRLLGDLPVNEVGQIVLRHHTDRATLVRQDVWGVQERNGYPANFNQIRELLQKLVDLRAAQNQRIGESQLGRLELLDSENAGTNAATVLELKGKDGTLIQSVLLGKESMRSGGPDPMGMGGGWPNGRWVYLPDKPGTAHLVSETFFNIQPTPEQWLDKEFVRVEKPKSVQVRFPAETNSWKLARETESGEWKLVDPKEGEQLDTAKVSSVSNPLSSPTFNDVMAGNAVAGEGTNAPTVIVIETFDQFAYTVLVGAQTNGAYPTHVSVAATLRPQREPGADEQPEDKERLDKEFKEQQEKLREKLKREQAFEKWTYLIPSWTMDPLLKPRSEFLKAEEPAPADSTTASDTGTSGTGTVSLPTLELPGSAEPAE